MAERWLILCNSIHSIKKSNLCFGFSWSTRRMVLSPSTIDYTSVLALDRNVPPPPLETFARSGVKRPSGGIPSCPSLDYTEVLQPTNQPPDQRESTEDIVASTAVYVAGLHGTVLDR